MVLLRAAALLVLALWVGGLAALGLVAAPAIFSTLEAHDPAGGRTVAGLVFGAVFGQFQHWSWLLGGLTVVLLFVRALLGPRPRRLGWRVGLAAAMLALSVVTSQVISPRIERIRQETAGAIATLPAGDPRRVEFGRLHGLSNIFMLVTLLAGAVLITLEAADTH